MAMNKLSDLLKDYKIKNPEEKILHTRQQIMKMFVDKLNKDRVEGGYKELKPQFYASKMYQSGLTTDFLLWWFWGYCNDAKNFSACWWGSQRPKNKKLSTGFAHDS